MLWVWIDASTVPLRQLLAEKVHEEDYHRHYTQQYQQQLPAWNYTSFRHQTTTVKPYWVRGDVTYI